MSDPSLVNPTASLDLDFGRYLERRRGQLAEHIVSEVPDYAFSLDMKLRQVLAAAGPVRALARATVSAVVPLQKQIQQMDSIVVSPRQLPEIYALGEDCARRFGIGVPQIFVQSSGGLEAYTIATDDVAPMIVLSSGLINILQPDELKFVIGHECGHIHNLHGVYNTMVVMITNPLAQQMLNRMLKAPLSIDWGQLAAAVIQGGLQLFFAHWSRCAEVTCDRAGLICCASPQAAQYALVKLATGGVERLKGFNLEEYLRQVDRIQASPVRFLELTNSHPLVPRRIEAIRLFAGCEVLHTWRPELRSGSSARSKAEVDEQCERVISVTATGRQSQV